MVNRSMQMKLLKLRKQVRNGKRAYLSRYAGSAVKVPQSIDRTRIPEDAQGLFEYRARGNTFFDGFINVITPEIPSSWVSTPENNHIVPVYDKDGRLIPKPGEDSLPNGRKVALMKADLVKIASDSRVNEMLYRTVREGKKTKTRITFFHSRDYSLCYYVEVCVSEAGPYIRQSREYHSLSRATWAFDNGVIEWGDKTPLEIRPG